MNTPPKIENAPGLKWKRRRDEWEARWRARDDLVARGYTVKSHWLWAGPFGTEPSETDKAFISDSCNSFQSDMLVWGRDGVVIERTFDGTIRSLIECYGTDADSPRRKTRYRTRIYYATLCRRLERDFGDMMLAEIKARTILHWHEKIVETGKVAMGHALIKMMRIIMGFGSTILEDTECQRLSGMLGNMRFEMPPARTERLQAAQAVAIRAECHKQDRASVALAQALQFDCMFRQKDVIGEWVPNSEPGVSEVLDGNNKWLRGVRWEEIDENMKLKHVTSKRQKEVVVDLKLAPMVLEELNLAYGLNFIDGLMRTKLPAKGPIIISEVSGVPWYTVEFRRAWRKAATAAGISTTIRNMDSRAGAISEATDAGADLEHVRHAATHSDISMTQRYSRGGDEKTAGVMRLRAAHRNKPGA